MIKYLDKKNKVEVHFYNGKLAGFFPVFPLCDIIDWEALRHNVPFFESDIDKNQYTKL